MKTLALRSAVVLLTLAIAWSCGDDGSGSGEPPTLDELPDLLVEALCPELESCLGESASRTFFGSGGCVERLHIQLEDGNFAATRDAVEAGSVHYDGTQVKACL